MADKIDHGHVGAASKNYGKKDTVTESNSAPKKQGGTPEQHKAAGKQSHKNTK